MKYPYRKATVSLGLATAIANIGTFASPLTAGQDITFPPEQQITFTEESSAWERANDWNVGDILFFSLFGDFAIGTSSGDVSRLHPGAHDPAREDFNVQAIEPTVAIRLGNYFQAFANANIFTDEEGHWDAELEEAFGKIVNIPGGFELRGGQFLNRFGTHNAIHLHSRDFIDNELVGSRFLGDHGLMTRGAELTWMLPGTNEPVFMHALSVAYGEALEHDHAHEHGHDHHDHGHSIFDDEGAEFDGDLFTARYIARYRFNDFHSITSGLSFAYGDNEFGRNNEVYGLDFEYLWRENGLEPGGRAFRWRNEAMFRRIGAIGEEEEDHHDHHGHHGHHDDHEIRDRLTEFGFYTSVVYTWNDHFDTGLRVGYVSGVDELDLDRRWRISPAVTYYPDSARRFHIRTQYNYDNSSEYGDDHSFWLQAGFALGTRDEVR